MIFFEEPQMKYYKYLYVSSGIKNIDKLKIKLNLHKGVLGTYVISLSQGNNQLEIMAAYYLKFRYYRMHPPIIVGLADSYDEALKLVVKMQEEALNKTGNPNIKDYLVLRAKTKDFTN